MRKTSLSWFLGAGIGIVALGVLSGGASAEFAQGAKPHVAPSLWHPDSNRQSPSDIGVRAHTNVVRVILPEANAKPSKASPASGVGPDTVPASGYYFETPSSLACIYGFVTVVTGCNPNTLTDVVTGGAGLAIAIVDAYDNPDAASDLATFDTQFGLPAPPGGLQVVYASGSQPAANAGWALESSLDIEWAHAMSPAAKIYLVEAASNSYSDLLTAVDKASTLVAAAGGGVVSMSWGGSEFSGQTSYDTHFQKANVTYLASTGDAPGVSFPSTSAYVVAVGGTAIRRNRTTGNFGQEVVWQDAGAGLSAFVARPAFQNAISGTVGASRGVPDIAAIANPSGGVWVYGGLNGGWVIVGGTSVASPVEAGIMSYQGYKYAQAQGTLTNLYSGAIGKFRDITYGDCGTYGSLVAATGWDLCSGKGSLHK